MNDDLSRKTDTSFTELLSVGDMYRADALTIDGGIPGIELMDKAGRAVAATAVDMCAAGTIAVLCGPGNNGGDGFVAATALADMMGRDGAQHWILRVGLLGDPSALQGDAKWAMEQWMAVPGASILPIDESLIVNAELVIDAVFGAGLARPIEGNLARLIGQVNDNNQCTVLSVDVPSGVDGNTGAVRGTSFVANNTVTFFRKKPGHLLLPGRTLCGDVTVAQIGISPDVLEHIGPKTFVNSPMLWRQTFPKFSGDDHKYTKGHALVVSGGFGKTGAARLAATAALRVGAGLVTVGAPFAAIPELAAQLTTVMVTEIDQAEALEGVLKDARKNAVAIGPGFGVGGVTRDYVKAALQAGPAAVLDADALTSFQDHQDRLFGLCGDTTVLTPHMGEFARLFPDLKDLPEGKADAVRSAAARSGAIIVLKGADTVIASPDGRVAINNNAPATLATAGAGDVLSGLVLGLLAQGMPAWEAACAAVWIHGACAAHLGAGLIAEDLPWAVPDVLESAEMLGS